MNTLIEKLKSEHKQIHDCMEDIEKMSPEEGKKKLLEIKDLIFSHCNEEEETIYARMKKESEHSPFIKKVLDDFLGELESLHKTMGDFFENLDSENYEEELHQVVQLVKNRLTKEENSLYPRYIKLVEQGE